MCFMVVVDRSLNSSESGKKAEFSFLSLSEMLLAKELAEG